MCVCLCACVSAGNSDVKFHTPATTVKLINTFLEPESSTASLAAAQSARLKSAHGCRNCFLLKDCTVQKFGLIERPLKQKLSVQSRNIDGLFRQIMSANGGL